jgi:hypothetical protein
MAMRVERTLDGRSIRLGPGPGEPSRRESVRQPVSELHLLRHGEARFAQWRKWVIADIAHHTGASIKWKWWYWLR